MRSIQYWMGNHFDVYELVANCLHTRSGIGLDKVTLYQRRFMNVGQSFPPASPGDPCKLQLPLPGRFKNKLVPGDARVKRHADLFACRG